MFTVRIVMRASPEDARCNRRNTDLMISGLLSKMKTVRQTRMRKISTAKNEPAMTPRKNGFVCKVAEFSSQSVSQ